MNGLEEKYSSSISFYRFDADEPENQRLQNELQLRGHPSVAIISENGEVLSRFFGSQPADVLISVLDQLIKQP